MKLSILFLLFPFLIFSQDQYLYDATTDYPFGRLNPKAPKEVSDYNDLIGICDCLSYRKNADQSWGEPQKMTWTFKYIMNGMAIQDETLKEDGSHTGSIRQFVKDSSAWYVHWYAQATPNIELPVWKGNKKEEDIILYKEQKAPNGMDGYSKLQFSNISKNGFNWTGTWTDKTESVQFPFWKIECVKRNKNSDKEKILESIIAFSQTYIAGDYKKLASYYTIDGKIFPNRTDIISGRDAIEKRWTLPEGMKVLEHKITPSEIKIIGDYAYDFGYYEGKNLNLKKEEVSFKGKYVIVWKKVEMEWKIYLDIWNSL